MGRRKCCKWTDGDALGPLQCLWGIGGSLAAFTNVLRISCDMADAGLAINVSNGRVHTRATGNAACPRECLASSAVDSTAKSGLDAWHSAREDACRRFV